MSDDEVYDVTNDPSTLESILVTALNKIRARDDLSADTLKYFFNNDPEFADFICCQKFIDGYTMFLVDQ